MASGRPAEGDDPALDRVIAIGQVVAEIEELVARLVADRQEAIGPVVVLDLHQVHLQPVVRQVKQRQLTRFCDVLIIRSTRNSELNFCSD